MARCHISHDVCTSDRERFFLRGLPPLCIDGRTETYRLGVWSEVSKEVYARIYSHWLHRDRAEEPRLPGTLANELPLHEQHSLGLSIAIQLTGPKTIGKTVRCGPMAGCGRLVPLGERTLTTNAASRERPLWAG